MTDAMLSHEQLRVGTLQATSAVKRPFRATVLEQAINCTLGDRQDAYGQPSDALFLAAEFIRLYKQSAKSKYCAAHDQALSLAMLKLARIACGAVGHTDNYVDAAAYFAIAAECQHLNVQVEPSLTKWCRDNGLLAGERLESVKQRTPTAIELEIAEKQNSNTGMVNPYAPVNKRV
jgi:hypothetical protein